MKYTGVDALFHSWLQLWTWDRSCSLRYLKLQGQKILSSTECFSLKDQLQTNKKRQNFLLYMMWCYRAFLLYLIYQSSLIQKYNTSPKANKHENMLISKPFAFYWPWSFGTSHHNWNHFDDFGSQMNFCHSAMPVHIGNNCTKQGKTNQHCTRVKWGHLRIYMREWQSSSLQSPWLEKFLQQEWLFLTKQEIRETCLGILQNLLLAIYLFFQILWHSFIRRISQKLKKNSFTLLMEIRIAPIPLHSPRISSETYTEILGIIWVCRLFFLLWVWGCSHQEH